MRPIHRRFLLLLFPLVFGAGCAILPERAAPTATRAAPKAAVTAGADRPTDRPPATLLSEVTPSLTPVPPQTRTPTAPGSAPVPGEHVWPPPAAPLPVFTDLLPTAAQQAALERLLRSPLPERDELELAAAYRGWNGQLDPTPAPAAPLPTGTVQALKILNHDFNTLNAVAVELLGMGEHAYFWFDASPELPRPAAADVAATAAAFDAIYEQSVAIFGPENNPGLDGDPRLHVVNVAPWALCDAPPGGNEECSLAGYFSAFDNVPTSVDPNSNAREMFVMNAAFFGGDYYLDVLAHEFRHMIEDNHDRGDLDWVAEGSAMLAEDLLGFTANPVERANLFLEDPDQQLNRWTDGYSIPYYGQAYLFNRYIYERLGPDLYRDFANSPQTGLAAVDAVSAENGLDLVGGQMWLDWLAAAGIHVHPLAEEIYRFEVPGLDTAAMTNLGDEASLQATVHQYAADYYRLSGDGEVELEFFGSTLVPLLDTGPASGEHVWISNRANYGHMRLTRAVDLRAVESATLTYKVYHDIEAGYDFGYVFASEDGGETWQALAADNMQTRAGDADPSNSALAEHFYTGRSETWREERIDLSPFAGREIMLRFAYVTDQVLTFGGLALDDITIPELGFYDDAETADDGWQAEGFERVTTLVPQQWHLQLITFPGGRPVVEALALDERNALGGTLSLADSDGEAILIVAATAAQTLEPAYYELRVGR